MESHLYDKKFVCLIGSFGFVNGCHAVAEIKVVENGEKELWCVCKDLILGKDSFRYSYMRTFTKEFDARCAFVGELIPIKVV